MKNRMMYVGDDGKASPFDNEDEMLDVIKRDQEMTERELPKKALEAEVKALRELVREIRHLVVNGPFRVCDHCRIVGRIDRRLAELREVAE